MTLFSAALAPLGIFAFGMLWCGVCALLSFLSGWKTLATRFRATTKPTGNVLWMQRGEFNSVDYKGVLIVGACDEGLYLAVVFPFSIGHAPLLIPWDELSPFILTKRMWLSLYTSFVRIERVRKVTITFYDRFLVNQIEAKMDSKRNGDFN